MSYPYYFSQRLTPPDQPVQLPAPDYENKMNDPKGYLPDDDLVAAVNVALMLGKPLLLTGEAGTGKTQLAYHLAYQLGLPTLKFETKSNSNSKDLFYYYDHLRHFQSAQTKVGSQNSQDYITYNALGLAILRANPYDKIKQWVNQAFEQHTATRSVVLIDEIDKAQRDFPNDILNEVEGMYFKIPELDNAKIEADKAMRPVLILTSNSEKHLPAAFLRRCVYYHIPFPDNARLTAIIERRFGKTDFLAQALKIFNRLRDSGLQKKPATAEFLDWLQVLTERYPEQKNLLQYKQALKNTLFVLVKTQEDRDIASQLIDKL